MGIEVFMWILVDILLFGVLIALEVIEEKSKW